MRKFNKPSGSSDGKKKPFRSAGGSFKKDRNSSGSGEKRGDFKSKRPFKRDKDEDFKKDKKSYGSDKYKRDSKEGSSFSKDRKYSKEGSAKRSYSSYDKKEGGFKSKRPFKKDDEGSSSKRSYSSYDKKDGDFKERRSYKKDGDESFSKRPFGAKKEGDERPEKRPFKRKTEDDKELSYKQKRSFTRNKELRKDGGPKKEGHFRGDFKKRAFSKNDKYSDKGKFAGEKFGKDEKKTFKKKFDTDGPIFEKRLKHDDLEEGKGFSDYSNEKKSGSSKSKTKSAASEGLTRLNKYLANAGIASRRDADTLIKSGVVKVNGVPVTEMGFKVKPGDTVTYGDESVKSERKVYLLLNKPKDYITTVDDPQERKTVMELIAGACKERVYPVGRLDRNTTGLLLFTNDGELTKKLTHPKHQIKKVYHVSLNKGLTSEDFKSIMEGVELEDGTIAADDLAFIGEGKKEVGIEIHSGRNRIVRRLFEHLGYDVIKLDRVSFAGLTKKDLPRGKFRFLSAKEISFLHMIG
jgi:23S rRNA pseudouridine2605 synthase